MHVIIDKILVGKVSSMYEINDPKIGDGVEILIPTIDGRVYTEKGIITFIIPEDQIPDDSTIRAVSEGRLMVTEFNTFVTLEEALLDYLPEVDDDSTRDLDYIEETREEFERATIEDFQNDIDSNWLNMPIEIPNDTHISEPDLTDKYTVTDDDYKHNIIHI